MSKSIKFKNDVYLDSSDVSYNRLKLKDVLDIQNDFMKLIHVRTTITVPPNEFVHITLMSSVPGIDGYTFVGVLPVRYGYADQWLMSISQYGGGITAMIYSKYSTTLTTDCEYMLVYIKTTYYNLNHTSIQN